MSYFRISDAAAFHAKLVKAGNEAVGAWARAGSWSSAPENLTEGLIPAEIAQAIAPGRVWARALTAGLVEARPAGAYQLHGYLEHNRSASQVRAERDSWRDRQRESRRVSRRDTRRDTISDSGRDQRRDSTSPDPDPIPDPAPAPSEHEQRAREMAASGLRWLEEHERAPLGELVKALVAEGSKLGLSVADRLAKGWRPTDPQLAALRKILAERKALAAQRPAPTLQRPAAPGTWTPGSETEF